MGERIKKVARSFSPIRKPGFQQTQKISKSVILLFPILSSGIFRIGQPGQNSSSPESKKLWFPGSTIVNPCHVACLEDREEGSKGKYDEDRCYNKPKEGCSVTTQHVHAYPPDQDHTKDDDTYRDGNNNGDENQCDKVIDPPDLFNGFKDCTNVEGFGKTRRAGKADGCNRDDDTDDDLEKRT